jgi:phosphohistidine phosphatase
MKRVLLLRHADASKDREAFKDEDRPLTEEGHREAQAVGALIRGREIPLDYVVCSPSVRTRETLDDLLPLPGDPEIAFSERLYAAGPQELLDEIRAAPEEKKRLLVVGHNPAIEFLARALADRVASKPGRIARIDQGFPTGAIARFRFDAQGWAGVREGGGRVTLFKTPKQLLKAL